MQQTETYQLNLIETSDNFSPVPLNENMDKVEAKFAALDGADEALDSRVTVLEAHRIAIGTYKGNGSTSQTIQLGFTPLAVLVMGENSNPEMATGVFPCRSTTMTIQEGGFTVTNNNTYMNASNRNYTYFAIC